MDLNNANQRIIHLLSGEPQFLIVSKEPRLVLEKGFHGSPRKIHFLSFPCFPAVPSLTDLSIFQLDVRIALDQLPRDLWLIQENSFFIFPLFSCGAFSHRLKHFPIGCRDCIGSASPCSVIDPGNVAPLSTNQSDTLTSLFNFVLIVNLIFFWFWTNVNQFGSDLYRIPFHSNLTRICNKYSTRACWILVGYNQSGIKKAQME